MDWHPMKAVLFLTPSYTAKTSPTTHLPRLNGSNTERWLDVYLLRQAYTPMWFVPVMWLRVKACWTMPWVEIGKPCGKGFPFHIKHQEREKEIFTSRLWVSQNGFWHIYLLPSVITLVMHRLYFNDGQRKWRVCLNYNASLQMSEFHSSGSQGPPIILVIDFELYDLITLLIGYISEFVKVFYCWCFWFKWRLHKILTISLLDVLTFFQIN